MNESIHVKTAKELERDVLQLIGLFYFEKNKFNFIASRNELTNIGFHGLKLVQNDDPQVFNFNVYVERPGLLIGSKGENIAALTEYTASNLSNDYGDYLTVNLNIEEVTMAGLFLYEVLFHDDMECQKGDIDGKDNG